MSKKRGVLEEEKQEFDTDLDDLDKRTSTMDNEEGSSLKQKDDDEKSAYEQMQDDLDLEIAESSLMSKSERRKEFVQSMQQLQEKKVRNWMVKRGKGYLLDFQDHQIKKLKECFGSLDNEGSGEIGLDELEEPLIGLGFADNRDEVQEIIDTVDLDGSGKIEFPEFLCIINNQIGGEKAQKINEFFKNMTTGSLAGSDLSFNMLVQKLRREYLMNAIMSNDTEKKAFGDRILKNVGKHLQSQKFKNKSPSNTNYN